MRISDWSSDVCSSDLGGATAVAAGGFAAWKWVIAPGPAAANSIAVLPFQNLSGDSGQQYLSDGLAAELPAKLARNPLLRDRQSLGVGKSVSRTGRSGWCPVH